MNEDSSPAADRPQRVNKRVARACDYCRKKRLYNAQCTWRDRESRRTPPKNSTQHRKREEAAEVVASVDTAATADLTQSQREGVSGPSIDPALELAVNPLTDPFNGFVTGLGELHWTRGPEYEACNSSPDFDNALHELGIGMSAPLWGLEGAPALNTPGVQPSLIGTNYDQVGCSGDQGIYGNVGRREASSSVSFSHSSISEPDTASGKVAGIQSLTRKEAIGTEAQASIPPGVLVRKNEVCTNLIGTVL
nr:uncharacterized protein CTRU02_11548 [Colletotrichum truncatum]KAF6785923.1 hypothetical protein CTRU02_11548 [Colletotrichum truncatum]